MDEARSAAERALSHTQGHAVELDPLPEVLRATSDGYATVARFRVRRLADGRETVVVKRPGNWAPYDPTSPSGLAWGFFNEWAALEFLEGAALAPRLYAGDVDAGVLVLEDLGDGDGLADALLGHDPERARRELNEFSKALGRLHAFSASRLAEYMTIRERLGPVRRDDDDRELERLIERFRNACDTAGVSLPPEIEEEIGRAFDLIERNEFRALAHGDACPDNTRIVDGRMLLIDYWVARPRHALLDGSYPRSPYPTCWCVRRIPDDVVASMETVYRNTVADALPALRHDATFEEHLLAALLLWLAEIIGWQIPHVVERDVLLYRGVLTRRQGLLLRCETFVASAAATQRFAGAAAFVGDFAAGLRTKWPATPDVLCYPAFNGAR